MLEEKEKKLLKKTTAITLAIGACVGIDLALEKELITIDKKDKPIVGNTIELQKDSKVYTTITDTINKTNGKEAYYDSSLEREVITAYYQLEDQFIRIDINDNYQQKEQEIINKNGKLVGILTTIDLENQTPEAFYNASDIKNITEKIKNNEKVKRKTMRKI